MDKLLKTALFIGALLSPSISYAQTAGQAITGFLTTTGCPSGSTVCFIQYGVAGNIPQGLNSATIVSSGTPTTAASTAPGDILSIAGGIAPITAKIAVSDTRAVNVAAWTVAAGGTGCTDGSGKTLTGTDGTGTKFQVSATSTGNTIVSIQSITVAGDYTVNPTLAAAPVSGDSCTGTTLGVAMGAFKGTINTIGNYQVIPINPVSIASSTGSDTTSTWTLAWLPLSASGGVNTAVTIANGADTTEGTINDTHTAGTVVGFLKDVYTALTTGPVPVLSSTSALTPTDKGGTMTTGGTQQTLAASNSSRKSLLVQNPCTAAGEGGIGAVEDLYLSITGNATVAAGANFADLPACSSVTIDWNGHVWTGAVSVNAATTGHRWNATESQ